jgi:hypothetical protein
LPAINFTRSLALARRVSRNATSTAPAAVAFQKPIVKLTARRFTGLGGACLQTIRLQIIGREAQQQQRGKAVVRARQIATLQPLADVTADLSHRQAAEPDSGATVFGGPSTVQARQQRNFSVEPRCEPRWRALGKNRGR